MTKVVFDIFKGINLKDHPSLIKERAQEAVNCDLSDGKIRPTDYYGVIETTDVEAVAAAYFPYFDLTTATWRHWLYNDRFLEWKLDNNDMIVYHNDGEQPQKYVRRVSINGNISIALISSGVLGQKIPIAKNAIPGHVSVPIIKSGGEIPAGVQQYAFTLLRSINGMTDESEPVFVPSVEGTSIVSVIETTGPTDLGTIVFPAPIPNAAGGASITYVIGYRLYEGEFREFARVSVGAILDPKEWPPIIDDLSNADLTAGEILPSFYQASENGDTYSNQISPVLDGICRDVFFGMVFGWTGTTIRWSDKHLPDSWPYQFNYPIDYDIVGMVVGGNFIAVLTVEGIYINTSTSPFDVQFKRAFNSGGATTENSMFALQGSIFYISDEGMKVFDGTNTKAVGEDVWTVQTFRDLNTIATTTDFESKMRVLDTLTLADGEVFGAGSFIKNTDYDTYFYYNGAGAYAGPTTLTFKAIPANGTEIESLLDNTNLWRNVDDALANKYALISDGESIYFAYRNNTAPPWASNVFRIDILNNNLVKYEFVENVQISSFLMHEEEVYMVCQNLDQYGRLADPAVTKIVKFGDGTLTVRTWTYKSGQILLDSLELKKFQTLEVQGSGSVSIKVYLDGVLQFTRPISFSMEAFRKFNLPMGHLARCLEYELTGTGTVTEVSVTDGT